MLAPGVVAAASRGLASGPWAGPVAAWTGLVAGLTVMALVASLPAARRALAWRLLVGTALVTAVGVVSTTGAPPLPTRILGGIALVAGAGLLAAGLAALGRALRAGDPGVAVAALLVVVLGLGAVRWADPVAEVFPSETRPGLRQAVLRADLATAAAYGVAGYDRLHEPSIYEETTIASLPVAVPDAAECGAAWAVVGVGAFGAAAGLARLRRRRVPGAET